MKLTYVEEVPVVQRRGRHNLQDLIKEFVNSDKDIARVDWTEKDYKNAYICRQCIARAVLISGHKIEVFKRGNEVYMMKCNIGKVR